MMDDATFWASLEEALAQNEFVGAQRRKCRQCGEFIKMYAERDEGVFKGKVYFVDTVEHVCEKVQTV